MERFILALDQGTTSSRAIVFNHQGLIVSTAQREFPQILPAPGIVEHDPEAIWSSQTEVASLALKKAQLNADAIAAIGITNQRETAILWDRHTGKPVGPAIVWQSRVSTPICEQLKADGHEPIFRRKTGLLLDPYFAGTKIRYLLDQDSDMARRAESGDVLFGTVDSFLIWRMTAGRSHVTDVSNASRTLLMNLETMQWDDELLSIMGVPRAMLPEIRSSSGWLGDTELLGPRIPITGCAGDQQAATFGQACFEPGDAKNTYGTGCFVLLNTGNKPLQTDMNLLVTVGWRIGDQVTYCLEGSIFVGGAVVQWLRDGLGLIERSEDIEQLASTVAHTDDVYFVPAFVGLGAPRWDPYARGTLVGITRGTTAGHLALAALESMAFQSRDVLDAMHAASGVELAKLKVDGGACVNDRLMQFQADILGVPVERPVVAETTALGAAYLAGLEIGYWSGLDQVTANWQREREFAPNMDSEQRQRRCERWDQAVSRSLGWAQP